MTTQNETQDIFATAADPLSGIVSFEDFEAVDATHTVSVFSEMPSSDAAATHADVVSLDIEAAAADFSARADRAVAADTSFSLFPEKGFAAKFFEQMRFLAYYGIVSCFVFAILQVSTNFTAYSQLVQDYFDPKATERSGADMIQALNNSKITTYADEAPAEPQENEEEIRKQLSDDRVTVREARFTPRNLLASANRMTKDTNVDFDITPYDNRIIVPKIGKNVPLVDVFTNNFDFDHMENIFMKELEKGVVRYPGTARPGETGNAFIFGHSSNYPWMKGDYNNVFALLDKLSYGDEIIVYYNQQKFTYIVREKRVIHPGDVRALKRDENKRELSLMTCWPVGTTLNRMLVFAELQENK